MSIQHAIDGEDPLFDFEGFGILAHSSSCTRDEALRAQLVDMTQIPVFTPLELGAYAAATTTTPEELASLLAGSAEIGHYDYRKEESEEEEREEENLIDFKGKGKAVSSPMDIAPRDCVESHFDLFTFAPGSSESSRGTPLSEPSSSTSTTPKSVPSFSFSPGATPGSIASSYTTNVTTPGSYLASGCRNGEDELFDDGEEQGSVKGKGKSRARELQLQQQQEAPPSLPPLTFHPTGLTSGETPWPADEHAAPSYLTLTASSSSSLSRSAQSEASPAAALQVGSTSHAPAFIHRVPSRTRSISSLPSMSSRSISKLKLSFGKKKSTSNLARKLLLCNDTPCEGGLEEVVPPKSTASFFKNEWKGRRATKSLPVTPTFTPSPEMQRSRSFRQQREEVDSDVEMNAECEAEGVDTSPDINHFDAVLPREIKLDIFKALLVLHEREGVELRASPDWTYAKSVNRKNRWIGRDAGFIELVRMSRVSKAWQQIVFDGQLWVSLDISSFPMVPTHLIMRLAQSSGSFVRSVDFTGHTRLSATSFLDITNSFCISNSLSGGRHSSSTTQLTSINLTGCSAISTHALNDIISHSPLLTSLNLKGLYSVTNSTMRTLADHCPLVSSIDISRCRQMDVEGLIVYLSSPRPLKELRASGLRRTNDHLMGLIGKNAPDLEVLDVGNTSLHNSGLEAYVSAEGDEDLSRTVLLTSREAGRDPGDPTKYRRRVTKLRHLVLSSCALLSDGACSNLAHAVPKLEFFELAGIGTELKDDGLVRLLRTTPLIRRLDLEENSELTDAVVLALTPDISSDDQTDASVPPQPGSMLEQLSMSYALHLTNDALLNLVRACTRLKTLELDNTRVNGTVVKEFVRLSRRRALKGAEMVAIDCRSVGESVMKDMSQSIRTRKGWRAWDARKLRFLDSRDEEGLGVGYDECDEARVVLKTFYSWQAVDAVETAREKKRKADKKAGRSGGGDEDYVWTRRGTSKWWSPGGRRFSGSISPINGSDSCIIM